MNMVDWEYGVVLAVMKKYAVFRVGYSGFSWGIHEVFRGIEAGNSGYSRGTQGIQAAHFGGFSGELRRHLPSGRNPTVLA